LLSASTNSAFDNDIFILLGLFCYLNTNSTMKRRL